MAGRHSTQNTDEQAAGAPEQWVPPIIDGPRPSGDGPQQYHEVSSRETPTAPAAPEARDPAA